MGIKILGKIKHIKPIDKVYLKPYNPDNTKYIADHIVLTIFGKGGLRA
jgi:hypothetical protein